MMAEVTAEKVRQMGPHGCNEGISTTQMAGSIPEAPQKDQHRMSNCINWTGPIWSQGRYGMDSLLGKSMGAHRAAWIRANGAIPVGLVVCHKCDNGLCVNVEHLFLGTLSENMQDCASKGRLKTNMTCQTGQLNRNAKPHLAERYAEVKSDIKNGMSWSAVKRRHGIKSNGHLAQILKHE